MGPFGDVKIESVPQDARQTVATQKRKKKLGARDQADVFKDLILALNLCHNVTPVYPNEEDPTEKDYQASSPDEIALVKFAEEIGMLLEQRDEYGIQLKTPVGDKDEYEILENFPFSSETKRMGIIVRHKGSGKIIFYVKGADTVMVSRVKPGQRSICEEYCENLAREGLRTLVISHKLITEQAYEDFKKKLQKAKASMQNREQNVQRTIEQLEIDLEFLAVTGVEDKLQDQVLETIETLRQAGIRIWMLTGDKIDTAKCIAISTGLKTNKEEIFEIDSTKLDNVNMKSIESKINEYEPKASTHVLMIDGTCIGFIMADEDLKEKFFSVTKNANSVCVCRCSPTQKAIVAECIKTIVGKTIACVGDGGNDVAMIQKADVGLGIVGKEGKQASLAADFSIENFKDIRQLITWHGRLSYKRSASLSQFVVHRGMIISFMQAIFTVIFYFVTIPIFNGYLLLGYSTYYTSFPIFALVLDEDVTREKVDKFPALYQTLQKGRSLNTKTFMTWTWKSIY